jgi:hypothetical protein
VCAIAAGADLGVSDAVSAHIAPRNGGASVSGAGGVHEALETLSGSFALRIMLDVGHYWCHWCRSRSRRKLIAQCDDEREKLLHEARSLQYILSFKQVTAICSDAYYNTSKVETHKCGCIFESSASASGIRLPSATKRGGGIIRFVAACVSLSSSIAARRALLHLRVQSPIVRCASRRPCRAVLRSRWLPPARAHRTHLHVALGRLNGRAAASLAARSVALPVAIRKAHCFLPITLLAAAALSAHDNCRREH